MTKLLALHVFSIHLSQFMCASTVVLPFHTSLASQALFLLAFIFPTIYQQILTSTLTEKCILAHLVITSSNSNLKLQWITENHTLEWIWGHLKHSSGNGTLGFTAQLQWLFLYLQWTTYQGHYLKKYVSYTVWWLEGGNNTLKSA